MKQLSGAQVSSAQGSTPAVSFSVVNDAGSRRAVFSGALTVHTLPQVEKKLNVLTAQKGGALVLDTAALSHLDTAGALFINSILERCRRAGTSCRVEGASDGQQALLKKSVVPAAEEVAQDHRPLLVRMLEAVGRNTCETASSTVMLVSFFGEFLVTLLGLILRPGRMRLTSLTFHMQQVGLNAVPIVALLTFLIGLVVAYMGAQQLSMFGADIFAVNLLEVTVMREMAVLITSIVVAGRSSSSFTAQIGSMVANEEVAALRSMGLDPMTLLVMPRVLALVLCLPMLVFIADIMALLGGAVAIFVTIDLTFGAFLTQFLDIARLNNFMVGMTKTPFFAMAIGLVGCFQGFRATGSSESVGFLTTVSVVQSIFIVIVLDALFAIFFTTLGI